MSTTNLSLLQELLKRRPEALREELAGYIAEHLDQIEDEMHWAADPAYLSPSLQKELDRREANALADPNDGVSWEDLQNRLIGSR